MSPARGQVALVFFPFSHSEPQPYKKRPVLVVSTVPGGADEAAVCVMVTGNEQRFKNPGNGDVPLPQWEACGLYKRSVVRTRRIWTAQTRDFDKIIGSVDEVTLRSVADQIVELVDPGR